MEPDRVENPYAVSPAQGPVAGDSNYVPPADGSNMVQHVMIIGILQIVQGLMELLLGAGLLVFTFFMPAMFEADPGSDAVPPSDQFILWMQVMYGVFGGVLAVLALLRIYSGVASFYFRGRTMMIVSLVGGLASVLTCYCAPLSIGLAIYGLVVMLNAGVARAYRMATEGVSPSDIKRHFLYSAFPPHAGPLSPSGPMPPPPPTQPPPAQLPSANQSSAAPPPPTYPPSDPPPAP